MCNISTFSLRFQSISLIVYVCILSVHSIFKVLQFLKSKEKPVDCILRHIDTSAIMDLVLKLANNVEINELRLEVLQVSELQFNQENGLDLLYLERKLC